MLMPGAWRENDRIRREGSANLVDAAMAAGRHGSSRNRSHPSTPDQGDRWIDEAPPGAPGPLQPDRAGRRGVGQRFTDRGGAGVVLRFAAFYGPDAGSWPT